MVVYVADGSNKIVMDLAGFCFIIIILLQLRIVDVLLSHVLECVRDQNGNHVIQKILATVDSSHLNALIETLKEEVSRLVATCKLIGVRISGVCGSPQTRNSLHAVSP